MAIAEASNYVIFFFLALSLMKCLKALFYFYLKKKIERKINKSIIIRKHILFFF